MSHVSELRRERSVEFTFVDQAVVSLNDARDAKLDIRDAIGAGLNEDRKHLLCDGLLTEDGHDGRECLKGTHTVVVSLLLDVVAFDNLGDEMIGNPVGAEVAG